MTSADIRAHILATPDPLQWDCFGFECIQRADNFTFFMSVDQLFTDGMSAAVIVPEIYAALLESGAPPQVRSRIELAQSNDAMSPGEFALVSCEM
jgi:mycolipenoyl-CoA---2-(long-chain-fatty acyl)-trehalose mycolipenoyltransferase / long-chain-acyl-CoA---trehalose acyltransferase